MFSIFILSVLCFLIIISIRMGPITDELYSEELKELDEKYEKELLEVSKVADKEVLKLRED